MTWHGSASAQKVVVGSYMGAGYRQEAAAAWQHPLGRGGMGRGTGCNHVQQGGHSPGEGLQVAERRLGVQPLLSVMRQHIVELRRPWEPQPGGQDVRRMSAPEWLEAPRVSRGLPGRPIPRHPPPLGGDESVPIAWITLVEDYGVVTCCGRLHAGACGGPRAGWLPKDRRPCKLGAGRNQGTRASTPPRAELDYCRGL